MILESLLDWLPHFIFLFITLLVAYYVSYFGLCTQDFGETVYWENLTLKFKAFLLANNVQLTADKEVVSLNGNINSDYNQILRSFAKHHDLLVRTKEKVHKIHDKSMIIMIFVVLSILYATVILILNNPQVTVGRSATYVVPISSIVVIVLWFFPIIDARIKIKSFIEEASKEELKIIDKHGAFSDL